MGLSRDEDEDIKGHCFMCGRLLKDTALPQGLEREITCLSCLELFTKEFEELEKSNFSL